MTFTVKRKMNPIEFAWKKRKHIKASIRCVVGFFVFTKQIHSSSLSFSSKQVQSMIFVVISVRYVSSSRSNSRVQSTVT